MWICLVAVYLGFAFLTVSAEDFCDAALCPQGQQVACNKAVGFGKDCGQSPEEISMTPELQQLIVSLHNERRSKVANGTLPTFPSAANMLEMSWDSTLASLSGFNARDCIMKHDDCRNTHTFKHAGQNLGLEEQSDQYLNNDAALRKTIDSWFDEYKKCPPSVIESYQVGSGDYGHFTQLVQDKSDRVGCAGMRFTKDGWYNTYIVCDYSVTNLLDQPVYATGPQCSQCTGTCGTNYPGLCSSTNDGRGGTSNKPTENQPANPGNVASGSPSPSEGDSGSTVPIDPLVGPPDNQPDNPGNVDPGSPTPSAVDLGSTTPVDPGPAVVDPSVTQSVDPNGQQSQQTQQPVQNANGWIPQTYNDPSLFYL